jgi:hypothetical protein
MIMGKNQILILVGFIILIVGVITLDQFLSIKPEWPPEREGEQSPKRPQPGDEPFHIDPIADDFDERRSLFLEWLINQETSDERGGVWTDIGKLYAGQESINSTSYHATLDFVNERKDPSDFYMTALLRLYYQNKATGKLTTQQEKEITNAILNYKYWFDEPNTTYVEMWTENHQILSASAEYLAGQLFKDETFNNDGLTGHQKMAKAKSRILRWIDMRVRTGFAEWDSETYYPEDIAPLMNLVDFSEDIELAKLATMMVDLILFDFVVDTYYGQYATSHGRVTASSIQSAAGGSMTTIATLIWGQGRFQSTSNMGVIALATSPKYRPPDVLQSIGLDNPDVYRNYERHSIQLNEAASYGLEINNIEHAPFFWGFGAFTNPEVLNLTVHTADEWKLWHYPDFRALKDIAKILQKLNLLPVASRLLDPDPNGILMTEVNKITYRTPDYMLSNAQDFRKGEKGYQQHIWQATLSPYAVVFVNNPDSLRADDKHRPSYWMANGRQPRTAQIDNVLIALYNLPRYPSAPPPLEARHFNFTHAYFPTWAFDEIKEMSGWIFGRVEDGYIALYTHLPYDWQYEGPDADQEIIALGRKNVWICQMGRRSKDGTFDEFINSIISAQLNVSGLEVKYQAPGLGSISFDWNGPLTLNGEVVLLDEYPRWDNPYAKVEFGNQYISIQHDGKGLILDFVNNNRITNQ